MIVTLYPKFNPYTLTSTVPDRTDIDPTAAERKRDHIELAFSSQIAPGELDTRFDYEPLLAPHPLEQTLPTTSFAGRQLLAPLWVSSMTGGTEMAARINTNLARACKQFGLGMGLGSCRPLLYSDERLSDFDVRPLIGDHLPLYANLGIAQIEKLLIDGEIERIAHLIDMLRADGLIVHVNPLQEWLQPEGDRFAHSPLETIEKLHAALPQLPLIVKEVGQGFGPASLRALLQLPLVALDFAANGGTNFSKLELLRSDPLRQTAYAPLASVGHSAAEMLFATNEIVAELGDRVRCQSIIISGGLQNFLDGYYLTEKSTLPAIYGQASAFLRHAREDYATLESYVTAQIRGLELARAYLRVR
jgi:isopentenyl-diphosphate delta-isomerase